MGIIAFIILGLCAGLIAKAIMPGAEGLGIILTTLLGVGGALLGGFLAWQSAGYPLEPKSTRTQSFAEVAENIRQAEGDDGEP